MKKLILAIMLLTSTAIMANTAPARALKVNLADGTTRSFVLSGNPRITFPESGMTITSDSGTATWARSEVSSMSFGDVTTSVAPVTDIAYTLSVSRNTANAPGCAINVFSTAGIRILGGHDSLDLSPLAPGLYIINAANKSIKYIRK